MGVKGLWELLAPGGRRVPLEKINNMRLAIDLSVWLMRMATALRDKSGAAVENPHLVGVFTRCCKLAFYGARPVFVFDGKAPRLKDATLRKRRQLRQSKERELERIAKRLVTKELLKKAMIKASERETEENAKKKPRTEEEEAPSIDYNQKVQPWEEEPKTFSSCFVSELDTTNSSFDDSDAEAGFFSSSKQNLSPSQKERLRELKAEKEEIRSKAERDSIIAQKTMDVFRSEDDIPTSHEINSAQNFSRAQLSNFLRKASINKEISSIESSGTDGRKTIASDRNIQYVYIKDYKGPLKRDDPPQIDTKSNERGGFEIVLDDDKPINRVHKGAEDEKSDVSVGSFKSSIFDSSALDMNDDKGGFEIVIDEDMKGKRSSIFDSSMFDASCNEDFKDSEVIEIDLDDSEQNHKNSEDKKNTPSSIFDLTMFDTNNDVKKDDEEFEVVLDDKKDSHSSIFDSSMFDANDEKETFEISLNDNEPTKQKSEDKQNSRGLKSTIFDSSMFDASCNEVKDKEVIEIDLNVNEPRKQNSEDKKDTPSTIFDLTMFDTNNDVKKDDKEFEVVLDDKKDSHSSIFDSSMLDANDKKETFEISLNGNEPTKQKSEDKQNSGGLKSTIFDPSMFDTNDEGPKKNSDEIGIISKGKQRTLFDSSVFDISDEKETLGIDLDDDNNNQTQPSVIGKVEKQQNPETKTSKEDKHPLLLDFDDEREPSNDKEAEKQESSFFESMLLDLDEDSRSNEPIYDDSTFDGESVSFDSDFLEAKDPEPDDIFEENYLKSLEELTAEIEKDKQKYESRARGLLSVDGKTIAELNSQVQYLLDLFGVPYVCSPSEADAQCAYLNYAGLVDAVVSDDVDVFLFGAQTVYRYLFSMNSIMEEYTSEDIKSKTGLTREDLQKLALFLGSDYTIGIYGVGRVHALEIITAFPDLAEFRRWCHGETAVKGTLFELGKGVLNLKPFLKVPDSFPPRAVLDAYQAPRVELVQDPFEWKRPNIDELRKFAVLYFGWPLDRVDKLLEPVIVRAGMMGSVPKNPSVNGIADIRNFFVAQEDGDKEKKEIGFANGSEIANRLSKRIKDIYYIRTHNLIGLK